MNARTIREAVQQMTGEHLSDRVYSVEASVISVDLSSRTCQVQITSGNVSNQRTAKLMSSVDDGALYVPTIDSTVNVILSDFTDPYITQYSSIDQIIFRGGLSGGLVEIINLTAKLNSLVLQLQTELTKIATGITGAGGLYVPGELSQFDKTDYENITITHGS